MPFVHAVWSLGCLLFAMAFGYSPFESAFTDAGDVKIVECTYLAVIAPVRFPKTSAYSPEFCELVRCVARVFCATRSRSKSLMNHYLARWILNQDAQARPSVFDVIERLHAMNP